MYIYIYISVVQSLQWLTYLHYHHHRSRNITEGFLTPASFTSLTITLTSFYPSNHLLMFFSHHKSELNLLFPGGVIFLFPECTSSKIWIGSIISGSFFLDFFYLPIRLECNILHHLLLLLELEILKYKSNPVCSIALD